MSQSVHHHRVLRCPPERLYRAFIDPAAKVKWLPPHGFTARIHHFEPQPGGTYRMSFINFGTGSEEFFGGTFVELVPGERLVYTDRFENPAFPGEMKTTVILKPVSCGTELRITQEGIPDVIPAESCYLGWQESLNQLARLVEPEIPDGEA